ncbi:hypothetical protein PaMx11_10 [Pseudomonas phage PaMx11]|uniref:Uncharacterized protein n=1 Tax=Pseudomonas phage PaMx11 TaxID=1175657 RepID=A0A0S0N594_BPPAM|nr:hypothetical protein AVV52_gp10 [Pseudomonas phage PaMx11]ALH23684.1 hypothetical protein PaMx11_10 [Pseudomonas phage PaMx11]
MANYIKTLEARVEELEARLQQKAELVAEFRQHLPLTQVLGPRPGRQPQGLDRHRATCSAGSPSWSASECQPPGRPGGNFLLTGACLLLVQPTE